MIRSVLIAVVCVSLFSGCGAAAKGVGKILGKGVGKAATKTAPKALKSAPKALRSVPTPPRVRAPIPIPVSPGSVSDDVLNPAIRSGTAHTAEHSAEKSSLSVPREIGQEVLQQGVQQGFGGDNDSSRRRP